MSGRCTRQRSSPRSSNLTSLSSGNPTPTISSLALPADALAEFIRELIIEGTHAGLAAAKARGVRLGRPPAMTPEQVRHARALLAQPDATVSSIARLLGVSRSTIYTYVPELKPGGGRRFQTDVPNHAPSSARPLILNPLTCADMSTQRAVQTITDRG